MLSYICLHTPRILKLYLIDWGVFIYALGMKGYNANRTGHLLLALVRTLSVVVTGFIDLLAASAETSSEKDNAEEGDLTGAYNFRTRKFDNGTDPYGWYEEDL